MMFTVPYMFNNFQCCVRASHWSDRLSERVTHMLAPAMLPKCSWRMDSTFHTVEEKAWGLSIRSEQPLWTTWKTTGWVSILC